MARNRAFAAVVIFTLAIGIAASTSIFSIVHSVLIRPLPFADPDRLVVMFQTNLEQSQSLLPVSSADFIDWQEQNRTFEQMAAFRVWFHALSGDAEAEQVPGVRATTNFFQLLGVEAKFGRTFLPRDDQPGNRNVAVITHQLWERRFGSDRSLVGQSIRVDGRPCTLIGILPPEFRFFHFFMGGDYQLWMPLTLERSELKRADHSVSVYGRLLPEITLEQAQQDLDVITNRLSLTYPGSNRELGGRLLPLRGYSDTTHSALFLLSAAVAFVLLLACANVAHILLSRSVTRRREMAIRIAVGSTGQRLVRQLLAETVTLFALGGSLGVLVSYWTLDFVTIFGFVDLGLAEINIDSEVLVFSALLSLLTGGLFGLAPAREALRGNLSDQLKNGKGAANSGFRARGLQRRWVVVQIALAFLLLTGSGLLLRSLFLFQNFDRGIELNGVLTAQIWLPKTSYSGHRQVAEFYRRTLERIEALPGVESASAVSFLPLSGWGDSLPLLIEGRTDPSSKTTPVSSYRVVDADYFQTLNIPLLEGRFFQENDAQNTRPVAIIDQTAASRFWPQETALSGRLRLLAPPDSKTPWQARLVDTWLTVVGIVGNVREEGAYGDGEPQPLIYLPLDQNSSNLMSLVVKTATSPAQMAPLLRREIAAVDQDQAISFLRTMDEVAARSFWLPRFSGVVLTIFAILALVLAVIGVSGVLAYSVTRRTHEIGVRKALGAQSDAILGAVMREGLRLGLAGIGIGLVGSLMVTRLFSSLLFGVHPLDPAALAAAAVLLLASVLGASYFPARQAARIDPLQSLKGR